MAEHTHETDKELWLEAHQRALAFTLKPGEMLTAEQRDEAYELIRKNEAQEQKARMRSKCY